MAEKEERIVCRIIEKGYGCDYCFSRPAHKYYQCSISNNDCTYDVCKQCSLGITRQEAIERMAKAICSVWGIGSCKSCAFKGDGSMCQDFIDAKKELAEAALNALLNNEK